MFLSQIQTKLPTLTRFVRSGLDYLLPNRCALCTVELVPNTASGLCMHCWQAMQPLRGRCPGCAHSPSSSPYELCTRCQKPSSRSRVADTCLAGFVHDEFAAELISRFKFGGELACARPLVKALEQQIDTFYDAHHPLPSVLLPVPLSRTRHIQRGLNQSHVLARRIGRVFGIPVKAHWLSRQHRPPQRTLGRSERHKLPSATFKVKVQPTARHVVVVDDVLTTGSTVRALRAQLLRSGADRVDVWCATRSMLE